MEHQHGGASALQGVGTDLRDDWETAEREVLVELLAARRRHDDLTPTPDVTHFYGEIPTRALEGETVRDHALPDSELFQLPARHMHSHPHPGPCPDKAALPVYF